MTTEQVLSLVRPNIAALSPYSTARDEYKGPVGIFMDANENPYGDNGYNRYPGTALKEEVRGRISALKGVPSGNIFLGNGSDEAIDLCYRVFCTPGKDNAVSIAPSYGMYAVCADINDIECRMVPLNGDFSLPVERLLAATDERTKLMWICSPNNPTGNAFPRERIVSLLESFKGVVVVDEAYIDFSSEPSLLGLLSEYPNLIVLQTLSKACGLAGLRIGLAFADEKIISIFRQVKYPYNIGTDTLGLALSLIDKDKIDSQVRILLSERTMLAKEIAAMPFVKKVYPSDANFLLVKVDDAKGLYDSLLGSRLIVRDRSRTLLCDGCLRITVGTVEENKELLKEMVRYGKDA
ncbi:MAG: histidinol-phosphate transaminase [Bacteroidales bacterium]|nr:histidinol-phosphate transaminase [Bacteroidales bacterium]